MKIDTHDRTVGDLLKQLFFIPRFQRPYSWERDQVEQFWNDALIENPTDYFIGSVVLYRHPVNGRHAIVDGQQRITTILLILCALRDAFKSEQLDDQAKGIQAIIEKPDLEFKSQYVLDTETSNPFLQDVILSDETPQLAHEPVAEERLLAEMYAYIQAQIGESVAKWVRPDDAPPDISKAEAILRKIRSAVLGLKLITIELDNEDDAYLIFETLNTRGKDLQTSHMIKNHLARLLKPKNKDIDVVTTKWNTLHEILGSTQAEVDVDTYLHHYWLSRSKYVAAKKLYQSMRQAITPQVAADALSDLISDANLYRVVVDPATGKWKKEEGYLNTSLRAISSVFRVRQPFPMLLSLLRGYADGTLSRKNVQAAIWAVECFHFKFTAVVSTTSSGGLSQMYASWAQKLFRAKNEAERNLVLNEIRATLRKKQPSEEEFVAKFNQLRYSNAYTKQRKLVKYILARIDDHVSHSGVVVNYDMMTVEHIAPQNPGPGATKVPLDHVAMLGNQILCNDDLQKKLANKVFAQKKEVLKTSKIATAADIVSEDGWNSKLIEARTVRLAKMAYSEIWNF